MPLHDRYRLRRKNDMKIVALSLDVQAEAYRQITAAFNASRDARRLQLEAEVRALCFA
jgi:hypothetical protein